MIGGPAAEPATYPVDMPLRAIRRRLRLIRYYSAARPHRPWAAVRDRAMLAALVLAWPLTWFVDRTWVAGMRPVVVTGYFFPEPGGGFRAAAVEPDPLILVTGHVGTWRIVLTHEECGWPWVTSYRFSESRMSAELHPDALGAEDLPPESMLRAAIEAEVLTEGEAATAAALWKTPVARTVIARRPGAWVANGIMWSIALLLLAWPLVAVARLAVAIAVARRAAGTRRLVRSGRCAGCGYDLRGSVFRERCPECGVLL